MKKLGENAFISEPGDEEEKNKKRDEAEKNLDPRKSQFICIVTGGQRIEVPLQDFVKQYGNPDQYSQEDLRKYVLRTFYKI